VNQPALWFFCAALFAISVLYSSVGQAGASGYIAAMAVFGFAPATIKPTAIVLNVLVAAVVSIRFYWGGHFSWRLLMPFALAALPTALIGGYVTLPPVAFNRLLGALLLIAAAPFFFRRNVSSPVGQPHVVVALVTGAGIGLVSGLTGVGGGVLITPVLLYCRWATPKTAASVSAVFILINSLAALLGHLGATHNLPEHLTLFALCAFTGGMIGAHFGTAHLSAKAIYRILGVILFVAGGKLLLS